MEDDVIDPSLTMQFGQGDMEKSALRGEPSYVWRAGQERRLRMILEAAGERLEGRMLENGCGIGLYVEHLASYQGSITGLEYDYARLREAQGRLGQLPNVRLLCAAGEELPFPEQSFDLILSHEVLEHVRDDRKAVLEMLRVLRPGGRMVVFAPNRGYPFETHGFFWKGKYHFGNIPLLNYLPRKIRDWLAPHVRAYTPKDLRKLFANLPVRFVQRTIIFGAYDNIIRRRPGLGKALRAILQSLERTPLRRLGLSHFWVVEKAR